MAYIYNKVKETLDSIYVEMDGLMHLRDDLLGHTAKVDWAAVKADHVDRSREISKTYSEMGNVTYMIDCLIGRLTKYEENHAVMSLALRYLDEELERTRGIYDYTTWLVDLVDRGLTTLISSTGKEHTNTTHLKEYAQKKYNRIERLETEREKILPFTY